MQMATFLVFHHLEMSLSSARDHYTAVNQNGGINGTGEDVPCLIVIGIYLVRNANGNNCTFRKCDGFRHLR